MLKTDKRLFVAGALAEIAGKAEIKIGRKRHVVEFGRGVQAMQGYLVIQIVLPRHGIFLFDGREFVFLRDKLGVDQGIELVRLEQVVDIGLARSLPLEGLTTMPVLGRVRCRSPIFIGIRDLGLR